jgi:glycosyltransferase involved in cell wall biosynthesis
MTQRIGYLVNVYPKVSHTFIRREIQAHEAAGVDVVRVSVRRPDSLVDVEDIAEAERTRFLLDRGVLGLVREAIPLMARRPIAALRSLSHAHALGRPGSVGVGRVVVYFLEGVVLAEHMRRSAVKHLHAHFGTNSAFVASVSSKMSGIPFSFTVHGPEEFDSPLGLALPAKIESSAFVVAISSYGRSQLLRWIDHGQRSKVVEVHCGLGDDYLGSDVWSPVPDNRQFVCVGRLCEQKGQLLLVEAIADLRDRGIDCSLRLLGDGEMRGEIEAVIAQRNVSDRVTILGWGDSEDVRREVKAARAFVLPSFAEGLPVVLMEALALGRPVVTTYIAGIPELVDDGCGWLVPAGDQEALADALAEVLDADVGSLTERGIEGARRVAERHDAEVEAATLRAAIG